MEKFLKEQIKYKTMFELITLRTFQILGTLQKWKVRFLIKLGSAPNGRCYPNLGTCDLIGFKCKQVVKLNR
jgi:hypothetical protein